MELGDLALLHALQLLPGSQVHQNNARHGRWVADNTWTMEDVVRLVDKYWTVKKE